MGKLYLITFTVCRKKTNYVATVLQPVEYEQGPLRLNWKRQQHTMTAPRGIHVGQQVYCAVQISYHRQVSAAVFD